MIIQDATDQSTELAITLQKALSSNKLETVMALMDDKTPKQKMAKIKLAIENKKTLVLHMHEQYGKVKVPRYEIVIDFANNEVHVLKINLEHKFSCSKFEVK